MRRCIEINRGDSPDRAKSSTKGGTTAWVTTRAGPRSTNGARPHDCKTRSVDGGQFVSGRQKYYTDHPGPEYACQRIHRTTLKKTNPEQSRRIFGKLILNRKLWTVENRLNSLLQESYRHTAAVAGCTNGDNKDQNPVSKTAGAIQPRPESG